MPQDPEVSIDAGATAGSSTSSTQDVSTHHISGESAVDAVLGRRHVVAERVKKLEAAKEEAAQLDLNSRPTAPSGR